MVSTSLLLGKINRRKIIKNFGQFFSIILITLLAVTLAVGLDSNARTLEGKLDYLLEETNFADGIVYGAIDDDDTHVFDILQYEYQKRLQLNAKNKNTNVDLLISDGVSTLNTPLADDYSGGVYITHEFARVNKYSVGDTLTLDVDFSLFSSSLGSLFASYEGAVDEGKENILAKDTITLEFVIDGLMYHSEGIVDTYPVSMSYLHFTDALEVVINDNYRDTAPSWWDFTTSATIISTLESLMYGTCNSVLFIGDFDYIDNLYYFDTDDYYVFDTTYVSGVYQMRMDISQAYQLTYVFPVVFIIVSVLIIITTISQLIFKERLNIATLKSIGISNGKIYSHYIFLTITLCLIGGAIGAIIGPMILPGVMSMKYDLIYRVPVITNVYAIIPIVSNILLFIIISTIVSYKILKSSVIMPPAALIKHTGNHKFKTSKIKFKSWSVKIAFRNISQNVFRSLMVVVGVGGCAALFITGFGIDDTLDKTTTIDSEVVFPCDATITFKSYSYELGQSINELESVLSYEEYIMKSTSIDSNIINVTNVFFIDTNTEFFNQGNFDGVYLSGNLSKKFGLTVGDEISFTISNTKYTYVIEYIIETGFNHGLFIPNDTEFSTTHAWVNTTDQQELDTLLTRYPEISDVYTNVEWQKSCADAIAPISIIKITLQVFAFLLGVVVLFNLALLNFKEKSRDIATLKVLGLRNSEISKSLIIEMMVLAILGGLLGLSVGYPLMVLLLSINEVEFITYIYNLAPMSYLLTFVFTTLTALIINLILFKQINKIKMVESLKSVE